MDSKVRKIIGAVFIIGGAIVVYGSGDVSWDIYPQLVAEGRAVPTADDSGFWSETAPLIVGALAAAIGVAMCSFDSIFGEA